MSVDTIHHTSEEAHTKVDAEPEEETSLEVPRPRLRIRGMTTIEHIVVRTGYEREALDLLMTRSYEHHKTFNNMMLIKTGLGHDMIVPSRGRDGKTSPTSQRQVCIS